MLSEKMAIKVVYVFVRVYACMCVCVCAYVCHNSTVFQRIFFRWKVKESSQKNLQNL